MKEVQKHKKYKTCKKINKIRNCTFVPAICTSYFLKLDIENLFNLLEKPQLDISQFSHSSPQDS